MITTATISIGALILGALIMVWLFTLRRIVPTNLVHIVQRGKNTVSYGIGKDGGNVYYKFPAWLPIIGVIVRELPVSNFEIELDQYEAYDKDRVPFLLNCLAFFHIADTNQAAAKVESFEHLRQQLEFVVQGAVRSIMATHTLDEIMAERSIFGQKFTEAVNGDLKQWGVEAIKNIELMDIKDSPKSKVILQIMEKRMSAIDAESRIEIANNKQRAENAEQDSVQSIAVRKSETAKIMGEAEAQSTQAVEIAKAEAAKKAGIAKQQSVADIAEAEKATAEKQMEVIKINQLRKADIDKEAAIIASKQAAEQLEIAAEAQKKQLEIQTNANKMKVETDAEARRIATEKDAAALLVKFENEAKAKAAVGKAEADVIAAKGTSEAEAKKLYELASVTAQTTLAKDIGNNKEYQAYMIELRKVEMNEKIGVAQAENLAIAMKDADLKVLVNSGDVHSGIGKLSDLFTSKGASQLNGLIEGLGQTEGGQAIVDLLDKIGVKLPTKK